jgi:hypothetical protein
VGADDEVGASEDAGRQRGARRRAGRTLRDALRSHPAGPEVAAALGPLADRLPPPGWERWTAAEREGYLDAALDEARARAGGPDGRGRAGGGAAPPGDPRAG